MKMMAHYRRYLAKFRGPARKEHADKAVIGNVLEAFMGTDDALWCTIVMDDERYEIFLFLGKGGRLRVFIKAGLHARFLRLGRLE